jgi:hypothetical protein
MLAEFVRMIVSDKYIGASDEIILRSDGLFFTVEVKKGRAFPECEELIKCANLAGFSAEDGRWEIRFSAPSASGLWTGLYTKTENKLLCLLKPNAF